MKRPSDMKCFILRVTVQMVIVSNRTHQLEQKSDNSSDLWWNFKNFFFSVRFGSVRKFSTSVRFGSVQGSWNFSRFRFGSVLNISVSVRFKIWKTRTVPISDRKLSFQVKVNRLLTWTRFKLLSDILYKL